MILYKKFNSFLIFISIFLFLSSCGAFQYRPVDAREYPPDPSLRVKKNIEEGRGARLMGGFNKGGKFDFASSNPLWQATLDTIDFMPLSSANYSGGIVVTDWYSEGGDANNAIKISIRFESNEIRTDALNIKVFYRTCDQNMNCQISENKGKITEELRVNILKKAAKYEKELISKNKKLRPYIMTESGDGDKGKKNN